MKRLLAVALLVPVIAQAQPRPRKIFISVDMEAIDETLAAAIFIGYHASEWTADPVRGHTTSDD